MRKIRITAPRSKVTMEATLNDTSTADKLWEALPITSTAQRWGKEVYFEIPVKAGEENPQAAVPSGTIAYWPPGGCFCIFFGQTPYSPVNVLGELNGEPTLWDRVKEGEHIHIEKADE